jgi:hypothetical protein
MIGEAVYGYWAPFFWGLAVLAGFLGWGSAIQRAASLPQTDWGLRCAWGMAFVTVAGGFLACISLAAKPVLISMVAAGVLLALVLCAPSLSPILTNRRSMIGLLGFLALILLFYAEFVDVRWSNGCDDDVAYFVFAKRLLDSGTLIEPFSLRRLSAYGGHSLLQAVIWAFGSQKSLHILDAGICGVVLAGMAFGSCRRAKTSTGLACLIAGATILLPVPRINSMSQGTGIVLFFALFRTLQNSTQRTPRWQDCAITAMCAAAACALRDNYIPAVLLICATTFFALKPLAPGRRVAHVIGIVLATALFLLPWMWLLHRSSGSWIYPLMPGNQQPGSALYSMHMTLGEQARWIGGFFTDIPVVRVVAPAILLVWAARDRFVAAYVAVALVTTTMMLIAFSYSDYGNLLRYSYASLFAALLAAVVSVLGSRGTAIAGGRFWRMRCLVGAATLLLLNIVPAVAGFHDMARRIATLPEQISDNRPFYSNETIASYRRLQSLVPPQAAMLLTMLAAPSLLDYSRPIINIDIPGACSRAPGMPFFRGPSALKAYLQAQGIEYIAFTDFETPQCLYDRGRWSLISGGTYVPGPSFCGVGQQGPPRRFDAMQMAGHQGALWTQQAPYYLDAMTNIEALARSEQVVFCEGRLRLIRLKRENPGERNANL